jgi:hypothetical protein
LEQFSKANFWYVCVHCGIVCRVDTAVQCQILPRKQSKRSLSQVKGR